MLKIGLTGNIGSGKTMVSRIFSVLGIPVYYADEESKKFLDDPGVKNEILKQFGYGILTNNQEINRRSLATIVFTDPIALQILNSILHPRVIWVSTGIANPATRSWDSVREIKCSEHVFRLQTRLGRKAEVVSL